MHCDFFEYEPSDTIWLATNHLPVIANTDQGIWRRVKLIPFTVEIPTERQDPDLKAKLTKGEGEAILAWLVDGCLAYQKDGLGEAAAVKHATASYRDESDVIGQFLSERCRPDPNSRVRASELFTEYTFWAAQAHVRVLDKNAFAREIAEKGYEKNRIAGGMVYLGLSVSSDFQEPAARVTPISFSQLTETILGDLDRYAVA
jgi:putative DNA primase/helicase